MVGEHAFAHSRSRRQRFARRPLREARGRGRFPTDGRRFVVAAKVDASAIHRRGRAARAHGRLHRARRRRGRRPHRVRRLDVRLDGHGDGGPRLGRVPARRRKRDDGRPLPRAGGVCGGPSGVEGAKAARRGARVAGAAESPPREDDVYSGPRLVRQGRRCPRFCGRPGQLWFRRAQNRFNLGSHPRAARQRRARARRARRPGALGARRAR
mmetsp:Transcript_19324/g.65298  ORF Transcript_19324/g.65298 Transcript_19324/m.65298 type:complete len:211 (+) Transcript_19324:528-1160(+)